MIKDKWFCRKHGQVDSKRCHECLKENQKTEAKTDEQYLFESWTICQRPNETYLYIFDHTIGPDSELFDVLKVDHFNKTISEKDKEIERLKSELRDERSKTFISLESYQELEQENAQLKSQLKREQNCVDYYADPENWTRRDTVFWENIDRDDCADYPHVTRDVRLTGGKRARELQKIRKVK